MNILIPDSWLREYLETNATPKDIQKCLSLCGPSVERINRADKDSIYDIEVTTNRVDCMSVYGIAREAYAILPQFGFTASLKPLSLYPLTPGKIAGFTIKNDPKLCKRIMALKVDNVRVEPSPKWLADKLTAVGQRPLNNLVDITNYVMWEVGHPTHVFDFDRLSTGQMIIREARKGEKITTLDDKTYTMQGSEVIIDDGTGRIIDLPSVMGTKNSVVVENTNSLLLFVDDVISSRVRYASMTHSIRTQAATLLEKDINPETSAIAMARMADLVKTLYPKAVIGQLVNIYPHPVSSPSISLPLSQISSLIGVDIPTAKIINILSRLDFQVSASSSTLTVTPPAHRIPDIQIPEDVIEEIARIYGYHNLPPALMSGQLPAPDHNQTFYWEDRIKNSLKYLGFTEIYSYSLVAKDHGLKLKNPLTEDWEYLRTSLFPSHRLVISENHGRVANMDLFEIANVYLPRTGDLPEEQSRLILTTTVSDYSRFKGIIEALLDDLGIKNLPIDIKTDSGLYYWEIPLSSLVSQATNSKSYTPISGFSPIFEDVNFTTPASYAQLEKKIYSLSPLIKQIEFIDKYNDKLTLRLTYHSDQKQLSGGDITPIREKINRFSSNV